MVDEGKTLLKGFKMWIDKTGTWGVIETEDTEEFIKWLDRENLLWGEVSLDNFKFEKAGCYYKGHIEPVGALLNLEIVDAVVKLLKKFYKSKGEKAKLTAKRVFLDAIPSLVEIVCNGKYYYFVIAPQLSDDLLYLFKEGESFVSWDELSTKLHLEKEAKDL